MLNIQPSTIYDTELKIELLIYKRYFKNTLKNSNWVFRNYNFWGLTPDRCDYPRDVRGSLRHKAQKMKYVHIKDLDQFPKNVSGWLESISHLMKIMWKFCQCTSSFVQIWLMKYTTRKTKL